VNPALVAIAALTVAGAVLAVSARDVQATLLGLMVVLLGAPLIADPWPDPLSILARIAATLLAVRLIAIGLRGGGSTGGTRIGWPAEALFAAAGAVIGYGSHGLGAAGFGPAEAQATGFALVVLAVAPLVTGRDALRISVGAVLLLVAASSIRAGLDPAPSQAEHLVDSILTIATGGAIAVITLAARAAGGLEAIDDGGSDALPGRLPDAHRPPDHPGRPVRPTGPPRSPSGPRPKPAGPNRAPSGLPTDADGARRPSRAPRRPARPPEDRP
jgi:hypothetical protein